MVRGPPTHSPHFELDVKREKERRRDFGWRDCSGVEEEKLRTGMTSGKRKKLEAKMEVSEMNGW